MAKQGTARLTKIDYEAIAETISQAWQNSSDDVESDGIAHVAHNLASLFERTNHLFRRDIFLDACGEGVAERWEDDDD